MTGAQRRFLRGAAPLFLEGRPSMEALTPLLMWLAVNSGFVMGACWRSVVGLRENRRHVTGPSAA